MTDLALASKVARRAASPASDETLAPAQVFALLGRRWPSILFFGLLFAAIGYFGASYFLPKRYTTSATIAIDMQSFAIPELEGALKSEVMPDPMPLVRSEVQVLRSPALARKVISDLNLANNREFNPLLKPPGPTPSVGSVIWNLLPERVGAEAISLGLVPSLAAIPAAPSEREIEDVLVRALMKDLAILNDNRSMIIVIQFTADSPELAAKIANSLTNHYITSKAERRTTANREANAALTQRIIEMRGEVESLERRIQLTRQRYNLVQTRAGSVGQQQLEDLSAALTRATADRTQLEANYQRALALARSGGIAVDSSEVLGSNTISILREREATAERRLAELSTTLGPGHPTRLAAQAEVASAHGAIAAEAKRVVVALGAQVQAARQREASLKQQLADAEESASGLASVQADLTQLEKDADARRALYQMLMQRAEQTEQTDRNKPEQAGSRVVSLASPPVLPSSPHPKLAGAFGMLSGIAFGAFLSLVRGQGGSSFSRQEQVATETGLVTLTSVPKVALRGSSASLAIAVLGVPAGAEAGAIRLVRTTLRFMESGVVPRIVLFVSSVAGEGSSSIAAAFGRLAAADGMRVLLVEGDLRNPSLARLLGVPANNGLIETLKGNEDWRDAIMRDHSSTLEYLLVADPQPTANQLMETIQLQSFLAEARREYNYVVIDSQPITCAVDASILANAADAVVLVVEAGRTPRRTVHSAISTISGAARKPPFIVLNKV